MLKSIRLKRVGQSPCSHSAIRRRWKKRLLLKRGPWSEPFEYDPGISSFFPSFDYSAFCSINTIFGVRKISYLWAETVWSRSSRSQMFFKIGILNNIANFTGKQLYLSFILIKLQACFPVELVKFLRTPSFTERL